jgi:hypothetical protein
MNIRHVRHFMVAAEESNFRRAGLRLDILPSTHFGQVVVSIRFDDDETQEDLSKLI